jgi:hypothetical protein
MKSPKERFQEDKPLVAAHIDKIDLVNWPKIADAALLQMVHEYGTPTDTGMTTVHGYRLQGARILLSIIEGLSTPAQKVTRTNPDSLPHPNA